jgi:hypothetical protein
MKALSIQQPWAWLIVHADEYPDPKRIENRTWSTKFRGDVLVHAGKTFDRAGYESIVSRWPAFKSILPAPDQFNCGGIVGKVSIVDCVQEYESRWFNGRHGFVLERPHPLPFVALRGMLGFFEVNVEAVDVELDFRQWPCLSELLSMAADMDSRGSTPVSSPPRTPREEKEPGERPSEESRGAA